MVDVFFLHQCVYLCKSYNVKRTDVPILALRTLHYSRNALILLGIAMEDRLNDCNGEFFGGCYPESCFNMQQLSHRARC